MGIVQLLKPLLWTASTVEDSAAKCPIRSDAVSMDGARNLAASRERRLRLGLLALTSCVAGSVHQFGLAASFIGCLTMMQGQLLPPIIHLRLRSVHIKGRWL